LITRQLKGLQDIISVDVVDWYLDMEKGWTFTDKVEGSTLDRVNGVTYIRELYKKADPDYSARCTVPVFWDKKLNTIVNNESAEIIRFMNTEFDDLIEDKYKGLNFYPPSLQPQIDEFNDWIYNDINNGVYKSGFATTQEAYEHNVVKVFESLDRLEKHLETHSGPYILGDHLTEVDIRLYVTIIRFDPVYVQHFKCNVRTIRDGYPRIHKWLQNLYWNHPAFKDNTNFDHIKFHYTKSHPQINPTRITPIGPIPNILPFGKPTGKLYIH
jgi:glutathionyl-hydroquinone reductase